MRYATLVRLISWFSLSLVIAPQGAWADRNADKKACVQAYEKAQELRKQGKLRDAHGQLLVCIRPVCPAVVTQDCTSWLTDLDASLPSVVIEARDNEGKETPAVKVTLDGNVVAESLDGRAMVLDPGPHVFRFEQTGSSTSAIEQKILIHEGEKNRTVTVQFAPKEELPERPAEASTQLSVGGQKEPAKDAVGKRKPPAISYALGGLGVVGLGAFAYFGLSAKHDQTHLLDTCSPACSPQEVDPVRRKFLLADIGLGVSVLSLTAATIFYVTSHRSSASPDTTRLQARVRWIPGGGFTAEYGGAF